MTHTYCDPIGSSDAGWNLSTSGGACPQLGALVHYSGRLVHYSGHLSTTRALVLGEHSHTWGRPRRLTRPLGEPSPTLEGAVPPQGNRQSRGTARPGACRGTGTTLRCSDRTAAAVSAPLQQACGHVSKTCAAAAAAAYS